MGLNLEFHIMVVLKFSNVDNNSIKMSNLRKKRYIYEL